MILHAGLGGKISFEVYEEGRNVTGKKKKFSHLLHCGGAALQDIFFTLEGNDLPFKQKKKEYADLRRFAVHNDVRQGHGNLNKMCLINYIQT